MRWNIWLPGKLPQSRMMKLQDSKKKVDGSEIGKIRTLGKFYPEISR